MKYILFPFKLILLIPVYLYKYLISPLLPKACKFTPSCSNYFIKAVKDFGPLKGTFLGIKRVIRCNPWSKGGYDPVPINIKGEAKCLF